MTITYHVAKVQVCVRQCPLEGKRLGGPSPVVLHFVSLYCQFSFLFIMVLIYVLTSPDSADCREYIHYIGGGNIQQLFFNLRI